MDIPGALHFSGMRPPVGLDRVGELALRPALFAGYRDLTRLRYDFPLVLINGGTGPEAVQSLSALMDTLPRGIGQDADRLKTLVHGIERETRAALSTRREATLHELWEAAAAQLAREGNGSLPDDLARLRAALKVDGAVVDCDRTMPFSLCQHVWKAVYEDKARRFHQDAGRLAMKLGDILHADFVRSAEGLSEKWLRTSVGEPHQDLFDFELLSDLLTRTAPPASLSESRRRRIHWLLSVLESQRFYPARGGHEAYSFVFEGCADAISAYRERLPQIIELSKAIAMARLEVDGTYNELRHDPFFANYGLDNLTPSTFDLLPDYLIHVRSSDIHAADLETILQASSDGLRAKILAQTDDLLELLPNTCPNPPLCLQSRQIANMAMSLGEFYVLQSPGSNVYRLRDRFFQGFMHTGPALFNIYSGVCGNDLPPYLNAAAAMEARAFPAFTYDPSAGPDRASRLSLDANPQPERDWPVYALTYEDEARQKNEGFAYTFVDLAVSDPRYTQHLEQVPPAKLNGDLASVPELLARGADEDFSAAPYVLMVDKDDRLHKVVVDDSLVTEAQHCLNMWHSLQRLAGIQSSHSVVDHKADADKARHGQAQVPTERAGAPEEQPAEARGAETASDEPYIDTLCCASCNECLLINKKMFAYDENKQAYIADPDAGTYRQLVEAAECCPMSIVHPGQPRNPDEPGLDGLKERAEPFL